MVRYWQGPADIQKEGLSCKGAPGIRGDVCWTVLKSGATITREKERAVEINGKDVFISSTLLSFPSFFISGGTFLPAKGVYDKWV